jgi:hypothetical protein
MLFWFTTEAIEANEINLAEKVCGYDRNIESWTQAGWRAALTSRRLIDSSIFEPQYILVFG